MALTDIPAVVTGGASGLGAATARALRDEGARVAIVDVDPRAASAMGDELSVYHVVSDVTLEESAIRALESIENEIGTPRILVNCAGIQRIANVVGPEGPMPLRTFVEIVSVNLIGTFNMIRLVAANLSSLEPLASGERGVIVNVSSIAAHEGQPGRVAYCASKGGVLAMTLPLAREFAPLGIRAVSISPGHFATSLGSVLTEDQKRSHRDSLVFPRRYGDPSEFAALVCHVCSNPMINGTDIRIDAATRMPKG